MTTAVSPRRAPGRTRISGKGHGRDGLLPELELLAAVLRQALADARHPRPMAAHKLGYGAPTHQEQAEARAFLRDREAISEYAVMLGVDGEGLYERVGREAGLG